MSQKIPIIYLILLTCALLLVHPAATSAAAPNDTDVAKLIAEFKKDPRGAYQAIRWFCPDGSIIPARERCSEPGGIQHALHKDIVTRLGQEEGIFLGQILAGTAYDDFWVEGNQYSRAKQYQMEKFLQAADNGWIMRRARYYRGALQAEDEERWGREFLGWLLNKNDVLQTQFYLARQITKDIPHLAGDDRAMLIRALSKTIADSLDLFMDIRIKIHAKPDHTDLDKVREFRKLYLELIDEDLDKKLRHLEHQLMAYYKESSLNTLRPYTELFPIHTAVGSQLNKVMGTDRFSQTDSSDVFGPQTYDDLKTVSEDIASLLLIIRKNIVKERNPEVRISLMDLSLELESILFKTINQLHAGTLEQLLDKNYILAKASAGCGYVEVWEWEIIEQQLLFSKMQANLDFDRLLEIANTSRREVDWGTGMVRAIYEPVVEKFAEFEPMAIAFTDDRIRSSILLPFGEVVSQLLEYVNSKSGLSNQVMKLKKQNQFRGLNPGFAVGRLEVITGPPEDVDFVKDKIYAMMRPPQDMKPVAGILTVTEGNTVSHVQLLARNLGIPNAILSSENLDKLKKYAGKEVFYAVSPRGSVVIKPVDKMVDEEVALVSEKERSDARVTVPTDKLDMSQQEFISLYELRAEHSGKICGPKAANLGQLSALFPGKVVPGLIIPFGIYRAHLDQRMPEYGVTYWEYLLQVFTDADILRQRGVDESEIEQKILNRFAIFRKALHNIPYLPGFVEELKRRFKQEFKVELGKQPIFIRSDTNMEDLKDFVGAGLNKTAINILEEETILQSIKEVWASPYRERSFRWRQKYLLNPENVFPSLLLMPSVNVEKSGVMITTGLESSDEKDVTVAMNWGGAGAVMGQATETYLFKNDGIDILLSPAREPTYNYLPFEGGVAKPFVNFDKPILNRAERQKLRFFAQEVRQILPGTPGVESVGPFDVELGFWNDQIWLFQVRPFVENKLALSSSYLSSLDPEKPEDLQISLSEEIQLTNGTIN